MNPETANWFAAWVVVGLLFGGWVALQLAKARRLWIGAGLIPSDEGVVRF